MVRKLRLPKARTTTVALAVLATLSLGACSAATQASGAATGSGIGAIAISADTNAGTATDQSNFLDNGTVHTVSMTFDDAEYNAMLEEYHTSGTKGWIEVTLTIDGVTYEHVGARLKGNSSLRRANSSSDPQSLPWLIKLDKNVEGQDHNGMTELVVRSNSTETSLNEAVSLDLLRAAGLASEEAAYVRLSVNGSAEDLRLVVENLSDSWEDTNFDGDGILYKAESTGDYSYRGTDPATYEDVFDQETGEEENLTPLIEFLDFINNSDDATFAAELSNYLDVESFARYLAFEELINNFDDIDGPGNNSYLYWDASTGKFTIVAWDHNLAFGASVGGMGQGQMGQGQRSQGDTTFPQMGDGQQMPGGANSRPSEEDLANLPAGGFGGAGGRQNGGNFGGGGGMGGKSNALVERFKANSEFTELYNEAKAELQTTLYDSGAAKESVDRWNAVLENGASDLVSADTAISEADAIVKAAS